MPRPELIPGTDIRVTAQQRQWAESVARGMTSLEATAAIRGFASFTEARQKGAGTAVMSAAKGLAKSTGGAAYLAYLTREAVELTKAKAASAVEALADVAARAKTREAQAKAAQALAQATEAEMATAIADRMEVLAHATSLMRHNVVAQAIRPDGTVDIEVLRSAPPGVLRKYKVKSIVQRDPSGERGETREVEEIAFETESTLSATQALLRWYTPEAPQQNNVTVNVAILADPANRQAVATAARQQLLEARNHG